MPTASGIPLNTVIAPDLAVQQQQIENQRMLAQLLLQSPRRAIANNPSTLGNILGQVADSIQQGLGLYAMIQSGKRQEDIIRQQTDAQRQFIQQAFPTDQTTPALNGPAIGADAPYTQAVPYTGETLTMPGISLTPQSIPGTGGGLNIPGQSSQQNMLAYLLDPAAYVQSFLKRTEPPDEIRVLQQMGIDPHSVAGLEIAKRQAAATQSFSPNQLVVPPTGPAYLAPPAPAPGTQQVITQNGLVNLPIPGAAQANAAFTGAEELARGQSRQQTTPATIMGPGGRPMITTQAGAIGQVTGMSPGEIAAAEAAGRSLYQPERVLDPATGNYVFRSQAAALGGLPASLGPGQAALQTHLSEEQVKSVADWRTDNTAAEKLRQDTGQMRSILAGGYQPGALSQIEGWFGRYISSFGGDPEQWKWAKQYIENRQFDQAGKALALSMNGGHFTQGFTDADREWVHSMVAKLEDSPDAARQLIGFLDYKAATYQEKFRQGQELVSRGIAPFQFESAWGRRPPDLVDQKTGQYSIWNFITGKYEIVQ